MPQSSAGMREQGSRDSGWRKSRTARARKIFHSRCYGYRLARPGARAMRLTCRFAQNTIRENDAPVRGAKAEALTDEDDLRMDTALRRDRERHGRARPRRSVGKALPADVPAAGRHPGQRRPAAPAAAQRASADHGRDCRHRHRAVGYQGQGGRHARVQTAGRKCPRKSSASA